MATRIYKTPFAATGDKEALATADQPNGKVSLQAGWTPDYELPNDNANYRPVGRAEMNGIFNELTVALGEMQLNGFAKWQSIDGGWPDGAIVTHNGLKYQSTMGSNTTTPGDSGSGWSTIITTVNTLPTASTSVLGVVSLATGAEAQAQSNSDKAVTPSALGQVTATPSRRGLVELATNAETVTGTDTERAVTPAGAAALIHTRRGNISFTSNGNWTVPEGVTLIWISGVAGGGGGGAGSGFVADRQYPGGGGGAGQGTFRQVFTVTPGHVLAITVPFGGVGGLGQAAGQAGGNGQPGGNAVVYNNSTATPILTLFGGSGGDGGSVLGAGAGGNGYPKGGTGTALFGPANVLGTSGAGASSMFGGGGGAGGAASFQIIGADAGGYGAGGAGGNGLTANASGPNGGSGTQGFITIEW